MGLFLFLFVFLLGGVVSLAVAAYIALEIMGKLETKSKQTYNRLVERNEEYVEAVRAGEVPFEPPPYDAQINNVTHDELHRLAALHGQLTQTKPPLSQACHTHDHNNGSGKLKREKRDGELVCGNIELLFVGKKKIRKPYFGIVKDTDLFYGLNDDEPLDKYEIIGLDGCMVKLVNDEKNKLIHALEIMHPSRKVVDKAEFMFIITNSEKAQQKWYNAISTICQPVQSADQAKTKVLQPEAPLSRKERMSRAFQELRGYKPTVNAEGTHGWLRVQKEEDVKSVQKRFCIIKQHTLYQYTSDKIYATTPSEIDLRGCTAELVQKPKNGIKLYRKAQEFTLGVNYIYLIVDHQDFVHFWRDALNDATSYQPADVKSNTNNSGSLSAALDATMQTSAAHAQSSTPLNPSSAPSSSTNSIGESNAAPPNGEDLLTFLKIESAEWFNSILRRFFLNFRDNEELLDKIKTLLETKMRNKLAEKKLDGYLERIDVIGLDLGDTTPDLSAIKIVPQRRSSELGLDFQLDYKGKAIVKFSGSVSIFSRTAIPFLVTATLTSLSGKMHLHCAPWPAERFSLSFYSVPQMDIHIDSLVGEKRQVRNFAKLNSLILGKLRNLVVEKTVMPNRRYITIPRAKKHPAVQQQQQQQQQISTPVATTAFSLPESEKRKSSANNAELTKERQPRKNDAGKEKEDVIELQEYPITLDHEKKADETDKIICEEANKPRPFTAENEGQRKAVIENILGAERTFIEMLSPLVALYSEGSFSEFSELHDMFGRVLVIHNYHHKVVKDLESVLETWEHPPQQKTTSDVFLELAEFLPIEIELSDNTEEYLKVINELRKKNSSFGEVMQEREHKGEQPLEQVLKKSAIITSASYVALIEDLMKCTAPTHPDMKSLEVITETVKSMANRFGHPLPTQPILNNASKSPEQSQSKKQLAKQWFQDKIEKARPKALPSAPQSKSPPHSSNASNSLELVPLSNRSRASSNPARVDFSSLSSLISPFPSSASSSSISPAPENRKTKLETEMDYIFSSPSSSSSLADALTIPPSKSSRPRRPPTNSLPPLPGPPSLIDMETSVTSSSSLSLSSSPPQLPLGLAPSLPTNLPSSLPSSPSSSSSSTEESLLDSPSLQCPSFSSTPLPIALPSPSSISSASSTNSPHLSPPELPPPVPDRPYPLTLQPVTISPTLAPLSTGAISPSPEEEEALFNSIRYPTSSYHASAVPHNVPLPQQQQQQQPFPSSTSRPVSLPTLPPRVPPRPGPPVPARPMQLAANFLFAELDRRRGK